MATIQPSFANAAELFNTLLGRFDPRKDWRAKDIPVAANDNVSRSPTDYRGILNAWRGANPETDTHILSRPSRNVAERFDDVVLAALRSYLNLFESTDPLQSDAGRIADAKVAAPEAGLGDALSPDTLVALAEDGVEFETRLIGAPELGKCGYCSPHFVRELKIPKEVQTSKDSLRVHTKSCHPASSRFAMNE
ncbi:hypothetical protein L6654_30435 [Bradyrhizobium sp. WYCCWR 13023]|uniref:Uncharacterized protein n=1 Tax=Bradyrhizobium zhengyangense TaxID=2911009 RepID=A0A9X1RIN8_9BRAD|nr:MULTISPECIES: hypothetical protein [Bradyrhizobium]MCG2630955.1 hypothetical protein [Bradyrhizobium zhengyangense]MCG2644574.1 hypothetical protein [Bradyrhizobium zhengyangense]MCG2672174.1 hypothetical protein [Bradyrhizobium zhengyangense]